MWMSDVMIVVNCHNLDCNNLHEIAAAISEAGAVIVSIDEQSHVIEAAVPAHEVPTVAAMEGVAYVRNVFTYFADRAPARAA